MFKACRECGNPLEGTYYTKLIKDKFEHFCSMKCLLYYCADNDIEVEEE